MKKFISTAAALALSLTMSVPALAADITSPASNKGEGSYTIGVSGTYKAPTGGDSLVSVDIRWDGMSFEYDAGNNGTWDPATHGYTGQVDGGWSDNKVKITVANHSNAGVTTTFRFDKDAVLTQTIKGEFYTNQEGTYQVSTDKKLVLPTAVGTALSAAPQADIYFGIDATSEAIAADTTSLGTITVSVAKTV